MKSISTEKLPVQKTSARISEYEAVRKDPFSELKYLVPNVKELSKVKPWHTIWAITFDWLIVVACFTAGVSFNNIIIWLFVAIVVAGRQHALLVIMHDAVHYRLFQNKKMGDLISNLFCSWPIFIETEGFRANHLPHHYHLNTPRDPDLLRKLERESEWNFPVTKAKLLKLLMRDLLGGGFIDNLKAMKKMSSNKRNSQKQSDKKATIALPVLYYGLIFCVVTYTNFWIPIIFLWFLPAFTFLPAFLRVKAIAEHFGLNGIEELELTRNYFGPFWERALFHPHNINYHLDHHIFPSVPFYNLPKLHSLLMANESFAKLAPESSSFFGAANNSVLRDISTKGYRARNLLRAA